MNEQLSVTQLIDLLQDAMHGLLANELVLPQIQAGPIADEFGENALCGQLYAKIYALRCKLESAGLQKEGEQLCDLYDHICRALGEKMFRYGLEYSRNTSK